MTFLMLSIIASAASVLLALAVVFKAPKRLANISFSVGMVATAGVMFGDSMAVVRPDGLVFWKTVVNVGESVMSLSWLLFALSFGRGSNINTFNKFSRALIFLSPVFLIFVFTVPQDAFFYSPDFESEKTLFLGNAGYLFNLLLLFYSIVAIVNLEFVLRSSSGTGRWRIKYMMLGVGGILALNIFYYSHALLYRSIDMSLLPVRICFFLFCIGFITYSILKRKFMDVEISVSRGVFFRTLSIFVVGFYLLGLGLVGEGMRYFGPQLGKNIMTFLSLAGAIVMLVIILSEQLRNKAMVIINKNFYSQKYDYRTQWLQFTQLISAGHAYDEMLVSIAGGFKDAIGARGVSVWLKEKGNGKYYFAKGVDVAAPNGNPGKGIINFMRDKGWVINVRDGKCSNIISQDEEFISNNMVSLMVPLLDKNNLVGFIILLEGLAGSDYNYEDYDFLKALARQATFAVMNATLTEELAEAKAMEGAGKVSSFIMHDLRNAVSTLPLLAQTAEDHMDNPEFQKDAIRTISKTSEKINNIIVTLGNLSRKTSLDLEESDLGECAKMAIRELNFIGNAKVSYKELKTVKSKLDRDEIVKVFVNLIINALDATDYQGEIEVAAGEEKNMGFVRVSDKGCGMSSEFIGNKLFKPFHTTKKKGLGIGLYQCKTIIEAHSGMIKVNSKPGKGTDFIVYLHKFSN
jgi:putative PEP-CTERM system histidine kinase